MIPQWAWASHQPVIQTIIEIYKPEFAFESGIGLYSTPILSTLNKYIGVETDKNWIDKVKKEVPKVNLIYHPIQINNSVKWDALNPTQKFEVLDFYYDLIPYFSNEKSSKLLFVDGPVFTRRAVISLFHRYFDAIIFHDSKHKFVYGYDSLNLSDFIEYQVSSSTAWTGVYLKNDIDFIAFKNTLNKFVKMFDSRWDINSRMKLQKVK